MIWFGSQFQRVQSIMVGKVCQNEAERGRQLGAGGKITSRPTSAIWVSPPKVSITSQSSSTSWGPNMQPLSLWETFHIQTVTASNLLLLVMLCLHLPVEFWKIIYHFKKKGGTDLHKNKYEVRGPYVTSNIGGVRRKMEV
jgi:hypothetical protein